MDQPELITRLLQVLYRFVLSMHGLRLHRSTSLHKHYLNLLWAGASLWSKVNWGVAFRLKPTSGMVSVPDLIIQALSRESYLFTCSPTMWPFWFVAVLDVIILHDDSWKSISFGFKRSKVNVTSHKIIVGVAQKITGKRHFLLCNLLTTFHLCYPNSFQNYEKDNVSDTEVLKFRKTNVLATQSTLATCATRV